MWQPHFLLYLIPEFDRRNIIYFVFLLYVFVRHCIIQGVISGVVMVVGMQYAFPLNKPHKKKKPGKQKLVGQKADLLFFHPTKECLQFLYVTVIEVLQSVKDIDTVSFVPGTGKEFLRGYAEVFTDAQKFVHRGHCLADRNTGRKQSAVLAANRSVRSFPKAIIHMRADNADGTVRIRTFSEHSFQFGQPPIFRHRIKARAFLHRIQVMMSHYQNFRKNPFQFAQQCH